MQTPSKQLAALDITLPTPPSPVAAYVPWVRTGNLVFVSGQIPLKEGSLLATGIVGPEVPMEQAVACAKQCAINTMAVVAQAVGSIDRVKRVVKVGVFVACGPGFRQQPKVANGASELFQQVFGENGRHARAAVGCSDLPLGAPVEVEAVFEVE